ncbi:MAG TPA: 23S rRNA (pseudouridine(1915)-N(3))-methyltransferase RlmH [Planctomycetota bacterium]|nr:23S rRNA (pseudouridine(1915)-N(3))-methyltransferase RlmH [Planctomycetota bacterium]
MKLILLAVGKLRSAPLAELCADYLTRLQRFGPAELKEVKPSSRTDAREAAREESERLAAALESSDRLIVLDERGAQTSSAELAQWLSKYEREGVKRLVFALGGAYGMTDEFKARGKLLALSKLTLPHELCRAVALEQLYRARTIQQNLPYHHA